MEMLPSMAFVPESQVIHYFDQLMQELTNTSIEVAEYFEYTHIGRLFLNRSRRTPPYPIRLWNLYTRVNLEVARTNNSVEGWHSGFQSGISCTHPSFTRLIRFIQAKLAKWESGEAIIQYNQSIARSKRLITIVS